MIEKSKYQNSSNLRFHSFKYFYSNNTINEFHLLFHYSKCNYLDFSSYYEYLILLYTHYFISSKSNSRATATAKKS